jgi:alpha-galactosidase
MADGGRSQPVSPTPYMGWNTYFGVGGEYDESTILDVADTLIANGLARAGYRIVWLDYGWASGARDGDGNISIDSRQWPHGLRWFTDQLHARGLLAGLYSDAGPHGGHGRGLGSMGHYQQDADQFAAWGFDAVKIDFVGGGQLRLEPIAPMSEFARAVRDNALGRPMIINICNFWMPGHQGHGYPPFERSSRNSYSWAPAVGDSWRTDTDVGFTNNVVFRDVLRNMDHNADHPEVAGGGKWNDPDYLCPEIGMTADEAQTQFTMWAMMAAPLVIGTDVRKLSRSAIEMLCNAEVIAIDQDPLGIQGTPVARHRVTDVWVKPLANGDRAIALLNRTSRPARIAARAKDLGIRRGSIAAVRNLWEGTVEQQSGPVEAKVPGHAAALYRVSPLSADRASEPGKRARRRITGFLRSSDR